MNRDFENWLNRPVYKVQVKAFRRAKELLGIDPNCNLATRGDSVLVTFAALPGHRDQYGQVLRNMVALSLRMDRLNRRINPRTSAKGEA